MNNVIAFPDVRKTKEQKSAKIVTDILYEVVNVMNLNGIDIHSEKCQNEIVGIIKITQAVVDSQLGIKNPLSKDVKKFGKILNRSKDGKTL